MAPRSVNRCIAVATHGRRCQQTTYRGSPYCWHHTQSRKVWAPSRMQARPRVAQAGAPPAEVTPIPVAAPSPALTPEERILRALTPQQLDALVRFLDSEEPGVFRLEKTDAEVIAAHVDPRLSRSLLARRAAAG